MTIRPFGPEDIEEVCALWARCEGLGDGPGDDPAAIGLFLARNPGVSKQSFRKRYRNRYHVFTLRVKPFWPQFAGK